MKQGRPKASSRETLAEAACELFLEKGYEATSVNDITVRAGVSRSSFFNYFDAKSDVIWSGFDERIDVLTERLTSISTATAAEDIAAAFTAFATGFTPDALALALSNPTAMEADGELEREGAVRVERIARAVIARFPRDPATEFSTAALGWAYGGAVLAATKRWAREGSGRTPLVEHVTEAARVVESFAQ